MGESGLRTRLVSGPASVGQQLRGRRWEWFRTEFPKIASMDIIDLGGTAEAWLRAPVRPASVHVVNIAPEPASQVASWIRTDQADACDLPGHIAGRNYDLVFSNSVIEHVGGHTRRMRFAEAVHNLSGQHWVQTPYRYFPIEPHWLFPGLQFLPLALRARIVCHWPLAAVKAESFSLALARSMEVELLSRAEMNIYFPESVIRAERVLGLPKSLVSIRK